MLTQYLKKRILKLSLPIFPATVQSGTVSKMGPVSPMQCCQNHLKKRFQSKSKSFRKNRLNQNHKSNQIIF